jgi:DNA-binding MarR family transcriptional regulator
MSDSPVSDSILYEPLYVQPGHLLRRAQQISASIFHDEIGSVTPIQYAVLCVVLANPHVDQVSMAGLAAIDTSTAASVALRLEEKGLLAREVDPADRRQRRLSLTPQGHDLLVEVNAGIGRLHRRIFEKFSPEEESQFMVLLEKLVHLNNHQSRAPLTRASASVAEPPAGAVVSSQPG